MLDTSRGICLKKGGGAQESGHEKLRCSYWTSEVELGLSACWVSSLPTALSTASLFI